MRSILEHLPDDHSVLLMYLADELPAGDRQVIEKRLANETALRAELETLREAQALFAQELAALDRAQPATAADESRLRQVTRQIRQWQTDRARDAAAVGPAQRRRAGWWLYTAAGAVAAIIVYTVWWGFQAPEPGSLRNAPPQGNPSWWASDDRGRGYNPTDTAALDEAELELDQVKMLRTLNDPDEQDTVI